MENDIRNYRKNLGYEDAEESIFENKKDLNNKYNNHYLMKDFYEFAIIATLMATFFPWSLLYFLVIYGMDETKLLISALLHDFLKTLCAIASVIFCLIFSIIVIVAIFSA